MRDEIETYLRQVPQKLLEELTEAEVEQLRQLVGTPGLLLLLGLLKSEQQACHLLLATQNLADETGRWQAAVIQGRIQGIERLTSTLLDLYPDNPTKEGATK